MSSASGFMTGWRRTRERVRQWPLSRFLRSGITLFNYRRCFGFASEGAFWLIFTLPFLLIGLLSAFAWAANLTGANILGQVEEVMIENASRLLTPEAVEELLVPFIESVSGSRSGLTLIGLGSALYSGSRVFATLTQGARALRGMPLKGYLVNRGKAVLLYLIGLVMLVGVVMSTLLMPGLNTKLLTDSFGVQWLGFIGAVLGLSAVATVMLYLVNPKKRHLRNEIPGGLLAVVAWLIGSAGLQLYIAWIIGSGSLYGAISSLVAIFIWALIFTVAAFAGMTLNITIVYARRGVFLTRDLMVEADLDAYQILIDRAAADDARVSQLRAITEARTVAAKLANKAAGAAKQAQEAVAKAEASVQKAVAATAVAEDAAASIADGADEVEEAATTAATESAEAEHAAAAAVDAANEAESAHEDAKAAAAVADRQASSAVRQDNAEALEAIQEKTEEATAATGAASTRAIDAATAAEEAVERAAARVEKAQRARDKAVDLAKRVLAESEKSEEGAGDASPEDDGDPAMREEQPPSDSPSQPDTAASSAGRG
ncbi:MAG: YihY/virulence factor BrkB family protein [Actinomycetia bacterium]|nr:YihY/virulence factor BrkB family protein [Actinomycetes bacterium]MCH9801062.1 YihY/virulence factor BrkB family protein [Actinomycetes bacterium]